MWYRPVGLPDFLDNDQVFVGTFSNLFASHVLTLRRMCGSNSFKTVKSNVGGHISNNRGEAHGGYTMAGPLPSWKADRKLFGGNNPSNPLLMTIDFILNAVKEKIPGYKTNRMLYVDKVGFVLTYNDYVQSPTLI